MIPGNPLQQLHDLDRTPSQFHKQLSDFPRRDEYQKIVPSVQSEDLAWFVEHQYPGSVPVRVFDPTGDPFQGSLCERRKVYGARKVLPKFCVLSDSILDINPLSVSGSVYEGTLDGSKIRIKHVSVHSVGGPHKTKETFHQVTTVQKHLAHPNIVPLLCVTIVRFQVILRYMSGHITNNPGADRLSILSDIAEGLSYLHSRNVVHGYLKGSNILVDAAGRAQITDCGLIMVTQNLDSMRSASNKHGHSVRGIAPEIWDDRGTYSKEADVFSFAMVIIEAFIGVIPFSDKSPSAAMSAILGGSQPQRLTHPYLTDGLRILIQRSWDQEARRRPPAWKRLVDHPPVTNECISLIEEIFSDPDETEAVKYLCGDDAQSFVDVIDEMFDTLEPWLRRECLSALCSICGRQPLLPKSVQVPLCYNRTDTPLYRGGYADVWKGEHQGRTVAVKVLRVYSTSKLDKITYGFCKEVVVWKTLRHRNILPLLGVAMNQFAMASEWMAGGDINSFVKAHRDVNPFKLLEDVARGLIYMHCEGVIHGDLKGVNILINQRGDACIADFGSITIVPDPGRPTTSSSYTNAGTTRWMSPELLYPDQFGSGDGLPTEESDCYALGMVIFEVLSGEIPFKLCKDCLVKYRVVGGDRPTRPEGAKGAWFTDDLWETLNLCWETQPQSRPRVQAVLECLERVSSVWKPPSQIDQNPAIDEGDFKTFSFTLTSIASTLTSHLSIQSSLDSSVPRVEFWAQFGDWLSADPHLVLDTLFGETTSGFSSPNLQRALFSWLRTHKTSGSQMKRN